MNRNRDRKHTIGKGEGVEVFILEIDKGVFGSHKRQLKKMVSGTTDLVYPDTEGRERGRYG